MNAQSVKRKKDRRAISMRTDLSAIEVRRLLTYDPGTGVFTRRVRSGTKVHIGDVAGSRRPDGYIGFRLLNRDRLAHRIAWLYVYGEWPNEFIDHINGDRADNRISNLRQADRRLNQENFRHARSDSITGVLGVSPKDGKYCARIRTHGHTTWLGVFESKGQAATAYLQAKRRLHEGCTL